MIFRHFLPLITWAIVIAYLIGMPGSELPDLNFWKVLPFDKAAHAFVFIVFTFLFAVAAKKQYNFRALRKNGAKIALLSGIFYGIILEVLQQFIFKNRYFDTMDILANSIGSLIGIVIFYLIYYNNLNSVS